MFEAIAFSSAAAQASHPDLSGTWILERARSDSSSFTPDSATYVVHQFADSLVLDRETPGTGRSRMVYLLDGTPRINTLRLVGTATDATSAVSWEGDTLVVRTKSHPEGADLAQTDRWWLGPEPATLRIHREAAYGGQSLGSPTLVFRRRD